MSKGLIFFCCACTILLLTIINLSVGPIISGAVNNFDSQDWGTRNCKEIRDTYDDAKKQGANKDSLKYGLEWALNECDRKKGMHDMEYTSFIFNMVIGFVCGLLGLLHLFDVKKEYVSKTGIIGLGCGIVGFIFSFVYVILNGLVYTTVDTGIPKIDSDGAFAERIGATSNFKCLYYDEPLNSHSVIAKYSDLIKKQYNYDKDLHKTLDDIDYSCLFNLGSSSPNPIMSCSRSDTISVTADPDCKYLYVDLTDEIINKDISDRFLTTLLLSLFVCLANIGLAIFGFLLFRTPGEF